MLLPLFIYILFKIINLSFLIHYCSGRNHRNQSLLGKVAGKICRNWSLLLFTKADFIVGILEIRNALHSFLSSKSLIM